MDEQSSETKEKEVTGKGIGESEEAELVQEWGWRRDKGVDSRAQFQRHGDAYGKELYKLRKISIGWVGCTNVPDNRQTERR